MAGETGFGVGFGAEFLKRLDEADKKLEKIANTSDKVLTAMKDLSKNGVEAVVKSLTQLDTRLKNISKNMGVGTIGAQAAQSVDAINRMVEALARLTNIQQTRLQTQQANLDYKTEANNIRELTVAENERARALERQDKANEAANKTRLAALTKEQTNNELELLNAQKKRERELIASDRKHLAAYKQEALEIKRVADEVDRLAKAYRNMPKNINQEDFNKLFTQSSNAKTINQHVTAIHNLKSAIKDLDTNSTKYKENLRRIQTEIARHEKELRKLGHTTEEVSKKYKGVFDLSGQLQRQVALLFSVSQVKGYVLQLARVRGEFEKQQRSIQVILRDKDAADKLWQQTVDLAVRSPFRVKELVTYTRGLAAYRIETDKLHESTKRLADVSAGLGVDMQRLILAYGQVRAANYLRGTELRQFTEAGIPMLDELAKLLTEVEGRAISAGDVFEMISKRMITFQDVEEVFNRMTSKGGTFFNMQEEQSKTLLGMWSNLLDSIDLMLNEIGTQQEGLLKGTISFLRRIVDDYQLIGQVAIPVLTTLLSRWAVMKVYTSSVSGGLKATIVSLKAVWVQLQGVTIGFRASTAAARQLAGATKGASLFGGWATIISVVVIGLWELYNALNKVSQAEIERQRIFSEGKSDLDKNINDYQKLIDKLRVTNQFSKERKDIINELNSRYGSYLNFVVDENTTYEQLAASINSVNHALIQKAKASAMEKTLSTSYKDEYDQLQRNKALLESLTIKHGSETIDIDEEDIYLIFEKIKKKAEETGKAIGSYFEFEELLSEYFGKSVDAAGPAISIITEIGIITINQKNREIELERELDSLYGGRVASTREMRNELEKINQAEKVALDNTKLNKWQIEDIKKNFEKQRIELEIKYTSNEEDKKLLDKRLKDLQKVNATIEDVNSKIIDAADKLGEKYANRIYIDEAEAATGISQIAEATAGAYKTQTEIIKQQNALKKAGTKHDEEQLQSSIKLKEAYYFKLQALGRTDLLQKDINEEESAELQLLNKQISALKEANKQYTDNIKKYGKEESKNKISSAYSQLFSDLGISSITDGMDFDITGILAVLDKLPNKAGEKGKQAIEKVKAEFSSEVGIKLKVEEDKSLIDSIEDMFENYEISLELEKLNIPPDLAKKLFGVDAIDLSTIRKEIENELNTARVSGGQEELVKDLEQQLKKVEDLEDKALKERLKRYSQFLVKGQSERVRIKIEELRELAKLEDDYQNKRIDEEDYKLAKRGIQEEYQGKLDSLAWKEFQNTDLYIQMFEDLDYVSSSTLNNMREKLVEMRDSLKELDPSDLKAINDQIEKIDEQSTKNNPIKSLTSNLKEYIGYLKERKELEKKLLAQQGVEDKVRSQVENSELDVSKKQAEYEKVSKDPKASTKQVADSWTLLQNAKLHLEVVLDRLVAEKKITKEYADQIRNGQNAEKTTKEALQDIGSQITEAANALPQVAENLESVFGAMDAGTRDTIESIAEIGAGVGSAIQGFASGDYVQGVLGVTQAISGIFKVGDKKKEREIQSQIKLVDKLGKQYENLEKQIDEAYSIDQLKGGMDAAKSNMEQQIAAYDNMIAAEEDKKKTDKSRIDEWKEAKEELTEQYEELQKEQIESMGGTYDYKDATREFVEAWIDAFNETGSGLDGLTKHFQEWWKDILVNQAVMKQSSKIMQPLLDKVNESLEDYTIDDKEQKDVFALADTVKGDLDNYLKEFYEKFGSLFTGVDDSGLSGLQRGIQGITESQADILASYLNSIRFYVSENNSMLSQYLDYQSETDEIENPMLGELRVISKQTSAINTLLEEVRTRDRDTAFNVRVIP